jgi:hypothetical protein
MPQGGPGGEGSQPLPGAGNGGAASATGAKPANSAAVNIVAMATSTMPPSTRDPDRTCCPTLRLLAFHEPIDAGS